MPDGAWVRSDSTTHEPSRVAGEVERGVEQLVLAGQADLVALAQEAGMAEDDLGRQDALAPISRRGPVEVGEHAGRAARPAGRARPRCRPTRRPTSTTGTGSSTHGAGHRLTLAGR